MVSDFRSVVRRLSVAGVAGGRLAAAAAAAGLDHTSSQAEVLVRSSTIHRCARDAQRAHAVHAAAVILAPSQAEPPRIVDVGALILCGGGLLGHLADVDGDDDLTRRVFVSFLLMHRCSTDFQRLSTQHHTRDCTPEDVAAADARGAWGGGNGGLVVAGSGPAGVGLGGRQARRPGRGVPWVRPVVNARRFVVWIGCSMVGSMLAAVRSVFSLVVFVVCLTITALSHNRTSKNHNSVPALSSAAAPALKVDTTTLPSGVKVVSTAAGKVSLSVDLAGLGSLAVGWLGPSHDSTHCDNPASALHLINSVVHPSGRFRGPVRGGRQPVRML